MIPLRDANPSKHLPFVTWLLVAVNVAAFVHEARLPAEGLQRLIETAAIVPARFTSAPFDPLNWITLTSSTFLHGGVLHLLGNMLYLWVFGDNVEDKLGHGRFLAFYVACGLVAGLAQVAAAPGSTVPVLGASGAVAGVLGAYLLLFPKARITTLVPIIIIPWIVRLPAIVFLGVWFVMQVTNATASWGAVGAGGADVGGVAWWAHTAGFVAGGLGGFVFRPRRRR